MKKLKPTVWVIVLLVLGAWCCHSLGFREPAGVLIIIATVLLCRVVKAYAKLLSKRNVKNEQS